jgi:hypothetical protein
MMMMIIIIIIILTSVCGGSAGTRAGPSKDPDDRPRPGTPPEPR